MCRLDSFAVTFIPYESNGILHACYNDIFPTSAMNDFARLNNP